jgi:16S rRNA U516 pseudouridylate synthase RsuA-like enzyme
MITTTQLVSVMLEKSGSSQKMFNVGRMPDDAKTQGLLITADHELWQP